LFGRNSFHGGIHPPAEKERTVHLPIATLPHPPKVVIRLAQHAGEPVSPLVRQGDYVRIGQLIGAPTGQGSSAIHASVSGHVLRIGEVSYPDGKPGLAIEIENDGKQEVAELAPGNNSWREAAPGELVKMIAAAGVIDIGPQALPAQILLSPPSHKPIHTLIINGIEDEPYLTAQSRMMVENTEGILVGALILRKILGTNRTIIAVENTNRQVIEKLSSSIKDGKYKDVVLVKLKSKYPQGSERVLAHTLVKKQVPSGGEPADIGCVVIGVATAYAVFNAVVNGMPLCQCIVTVSGPALRSPKNVSAPVGTPLRWMLDFCEVDRDRLYKVILGGPMSGQAQSDLEVSVGKSALGIVAFDNSRGIPHRCVCINCGGCVKACPMRLVPSYIVKYVGINNLTTAAAWGLEECIECGSCAYVCPSKIDLIHYMKLGKYLIARDADYPHAKKGT
jgi:electron transport complex protein RnfC